MTSRHRFFVAPECLQGDRLTLRGHLPHQLLHVLRLGPGDRITVLDNSGYEYQVELTSLSPKAAEGVVSGRNLAPGEPALRLVLYQGLLRGNRFEMVLQKGTELGVAGFVPLICQRSVALADGEGRLARWQRIIQEAAEQSHRGRLPFLEPPMPFSEAMSSWEGLTLIPWEEEAKTGLRQALGMGLEGRVNLVIGPEGGIAEEEVAQARSQGAVTVSLGRRILRSETAGLAAVAVILFQAGELGSAPAGRPPPAG